MSNWKEEVEEFELIPPAAVELIDRLLQFKLSEAVLRAIFVSSGEKKLRSTVVGGGSVSVACQCNPGDFDLARRDMFESDDLGEKQRVRANHLSGRLS